MQENTKGTYFPVSGEVVPIFAKDKLTGMAIVCRNISEEEMQKRFSIWLLRKVPFIRGSTTHG